MPRRRKRHVSKPALSFMESPVAVYNESVTHLHCADEPTTADVVTLDENLTVQWVSPQFRMQAAGLGRSLRSRTVQAGGEKTILCRSQCSRPSHRLKPLDFRKSSENMEEPQADNKNVYICTNENVNSEEQTSPSQFTEIRDRNRPRGTIHNTDLSSPSKDFAVGSVDANLSCPLIETDNINHVHTPLHNILPKDDCIKREELFNLAMTPVPRTRPTDILVADTPVQDYGLPVRLRRLRKGR